MKTKIVSIIAVLTIIFSISVSAQSDLQQKLKDKMKDMGYTWLTTQFATISQGNTAYHYRTMYAYNNYAIVAYPAESGVTDMDIYIYDTDGSLLTKDSEVDKIAVAEYTPYSTREMKIVIKNYAAYCTSCEYRCEFMVFYK